MRKKEVCFYILIFFFIVFVSWVLFEHRKETGIFVFLCLSSGGFLVLHIKALKSLRKVIKRQKYNYRQIESLFVIFSSLDIKEPIPHMRGWSISPDFGRLILLLVSKYKPSLVLELGSGVSTILTAYSLRKYGGGFVISLEGDQFFAKETERLVELHKLRDIVKIVYSPYKECVIKNRKWIWYDVENIDFPGKIDMVIVDGPPAALQKMSRYPALPLLIDMLSERVVVIMDDAYRSDERKIIEFWKEEFKKFSFEIVDCEKGALVLKRGLQ